MRYLFILFIVTAFFFLSPKVHAYSDEEILSALQKEIELNDADSMLYYTDKDRAVIADFMKKNQELFASLGKDETRYYVELARLNRNPNVTLNVVLCAIDAYKRNFTKYSVAELEELKKKFSKLYDSKILLQKQWDDVKTFKPK